MKKIMMIPLFVLMMSMMALSVSADTVTYDFEGCYNLNDCGVTEVGHNQGLNQSYPLEYIGERVLFFNGERGDHTVAYDPYVINFDSIPTNTYKMSFDAYPTGVDPSATNIFDASFRGSYFGGKIYPASYPATRYGVGYTNNYAGGCVGSVYYDFNGLEWVQTGSCMPRNTWTHVDIIMNLTTQSMNVYYDDVLEVSADFSDHIGDIGNLDGSDFAWIKSASANTPEVYFDNITFTNATAPQPPTPQNATSVIYDFESCGNVSSCGLTELGYVNPLTENTSIKFFDGGNRLWLNGIRQAGAPYERSIIAFDNIPVNATKVSFDIQKYGSTPNNFKYLASAVDTGGIDNQYVGYNTGSTSYVLYDFNGYSYNTSCAQISSSVWVNITLEMDYETQTMNQYVNGALWCVSDWSGDSSEVGTLGDYAYFVAETTEEQNTYIDNVNFTSYTAEAPEPNTAPSIDSFVPLDLTPEITTITDQTFAVTASDPENDSLTYEWLVDDLVVDTGVMSYLAVGADLGVGTYNITARVSDGGFSVQQEWELDVIFINTEIVIHGTTPESVISINFADNPVFFINATDADPLQTLIYQWEVNGSVVAETSNTFTFTDAELYRGELVEVKVYVTDGIQVLSNSWAVDVAFSTYQPNYVTGDVTAVAIDGVTKLGITFIAFVTLIGVVLVGAWAMKKFRK